MITKDQIANDLATISNQIKSAPPEQLGSLLHEAKIYMHKIWADYEATVTNGVNLHAGSGAMASITGTLK